jgi:DNA-directed RNA polymerase specialized sigma24 family protein
MRRMGRTGVSGGVNDQSVREAPDYAVSVAPAVEAAGRALVARYGPDLGPDVAAEMEAWAWEHQTQVLAAGNPAGYLFRVGQSRARRYLRWRRSAPWSPLPERDGLPDVDLERAVGGLPHAQRSAVLLVHGFGYSYAEAADLLGTSEGSIRNHLHRGMERLRALLEVTDG